MSTWTNVTIPDRFSSLQQCYDKIAELEFRNQRLNEKLNSYEKELSNIFDSLKENKEITITSYKETIKARLVE